MIKLDEIKAKYNFNNLTLNIFITFFMFFLVYDSFSIAIPLYLKQIEVNTFYYGLIVSASTILRAIIVIPISHTKKFNKLSILSATLICNIFIVLAVVLMKNVFMSIIGFVMLLTSVSIFNVIMNPVIASTTPESKLGITFGVRDVFLYAGSAFGLLITGLLLQNISYSYLFMLLMLCFLVCVFIIKHLNRIISSSTKYEDDEKLKEDMREEKGGLLKSFAEHAKLTISDKQFVFYCIFTCFLTITATGLGFAPLLGKNYEISDSSIYYIFSSSIILSSILSIIGGIVIDRYNKKKIYIAYAFIFMLVYSTFLYNNKILFIIGILLNSINMAFANIAPAYFFDIYTGEKGNQYWGIVSSITLITSSISSLFIAYIWDSNYYIAIILSFVMAIVSLLLSFRLSDKRKEA